jgi:hypothetical protein
MAIGPIRFLEVFNATIDEYEKLIDKQLEAHELKKDITSISVRVSRELTELHFKVLRKKYIDAGWADVERYEGVHARLKFKFIEPIIS